MRSSLQSTGLLLVLGACGPATDDGPDASTEARATACAVPLAPPPGWESDTISDASRCDMLLIAWRELARMHDAEPHLSPGDTARIASADVYDMDRENGDTGEITPLRHVVVDIPGRPRLFGVSVNRNSGAVESVGIVHRGGF